MPAARSAGYPKRASCATVADGRGGCVAVSETPLKHASATGQNRQHMAVAIASRAQALAGSWRLAHLRGSPSHEEGNDKEGLESTADSHHE